MPVIVHGSCISVSLYSVELEIVGEVRTWRPLGPSLLPSCLTMCCRACPNILQSFPVTLTKVARNDEFQYKIVILDWISMVDKKLSQEAVCHTQPKGTAPPSPTSHRALIRTRWGRLVGTYINYLPQSKHHTPSTGRPDRISHWR